MKLIILGSGGATTIPRPGCQCKVCCEARVKGIPYARSSASMYIPDVKILFDTPEEIAFQLNREEISDIDYIFYSHWHPDHTLGLRIVEKMYKFWLGKFVRGEKPVKKVKICALKSVFGDLKEKYGSFLDFYRASDLIETAELEDGQPFNVGDYKVIPFEVHGAYVTSTVFSIEVGGKKVIYAPCDAKPFPKDARLKNPNLLILGDVLPEGPLKEGITIPIDNPLRKELFSMSELLELMERLNVGKVILTHIEEEWGKSYDDYRVLEKNYGGRICFAYDGMKITV
ncbi:MAG: MBL fold metallo-hydrolase [Candidatus Bathyarchaeia archaeon]